MNYLKPYSFSLSYIFYCAISFAKNRALLNTPNRFGLFQLPDFPGHSPEFHQQIILATSKYDNSLQGAVVSFNGKSLMPSLPHHY